MPSTAVDPPSTSRLPPSLRPIESKAVSTFRESGACDVTAEVAGVLTVFECFLDAVNARPIDRSQWPGEIYRNLLSMIHFAKCKWLARPFDERDCERPTWPREFEAFHNFLSALRQNLGQVQDQAAAAWWTYAALRWPEQERQ